MLVWELLRFFTVFFSTKCWNNTVLLRVGLHCYFDLTIFLVIAGKETFFYQNNWSLRHFPKMTRKFCVFLLSRYIYIYICNTLLQSNILQYYSIKIWSYLVILWYHHIVIIYGYYDIYCDNIWIYIWYISGYHTVSQWYRTCMCTSKGLTGMISPSPAFRLRAPSASPHQVVLRWQPKAEAKPKRQMWILTQTHGDSQKSTCGNITTCSHFLSVSHGKWSSKVEM